MNLLGIHHPSLHWLLYPLVRERLSYHSILEVYNALSPGSQLRSDNQAPQSYLIQVKEQTLDSRLYIWHWHVRLWEPWEESECTLYVDMNLVGKQQEQRDKE